MGKNIPEMIQNPEPRITEKTSDCLFLWKGQTKLSENVNSTSTKDQYSIIEGCQGIRIREHVTDYVLCLQLFEECFFLLTGLGSHIYQLGNYNYYLVNNTTPIGSSIEFARFCEQRSLFVMRKTDSEKQRCNTSKTRLPQNARKLYSMQGKTTTYIWQPKEKRSS